MLILVAKSYDARGVSILCANWKGPQRDLLELSGFYNVIPPANLFLGLHDAVVEARKRCDMPRRWKQFCFCLPPPLT